MVLQIKQELNVKDFANFNVLTLNETESYQIYSHPFILSPDSITHSWYICLTFDILKPQYYGFFLHLIDKQFKKCIFAKLRFKAFNDKDEILYQNQSPIYYKFNKNIGHGPRNAIDRSKCNIKSIRKVCVEIELSREEIMISKGIEQHQSTADILKKNLSKFYENNKFTDVTIICGNHKFHVHKNILAGVSPVFQAMFESEMQEASSNIIQMTEVNPEAMKIFLKFLYADEIIIPIDIVEDVLDLGEKYNLKDLKYICELKLKDYIDVPKAVGFLIAADKYRLPIAKRRAMEFVKENLIDVMKSESWKNSMEHHFHLLEELMVILKS